MLLKNNMEDESLIVDPNEVQFEKHDDIEMLVIDSGLIHDLDHNDPGYLNQLLKTIKIEKVTVKSYEFFKKIGEYLENEKYANENTQILKEVIHDEPNYLYEIMFLGIDDENKISVENFNGLGTLLNVKENHIFGKVIFLKSHLPVDDMNSMSFASVDVKDIYNLLHSRVHTKAIVYEDGEFREEIMNGQMDVYSKKIFSENFYLDEEMPFLLHNLNIHYTTDEYGEEFMPNLVKGKIDLAVFFTMTTENLRGNLTLDELKKIIYLSNKLENFKPTEELLKDEKDDLGRTIIKNKYRILNKVYDQIKNLN